MVSYEMIIETEELQAGSPHHESATLGLVDLTRVLQDFAEPRRETTVISLT
jgi:hypothetical protein